MKSLKIAIITFIMDKPVEFRVGLILAGCLAAVMDSWMITRQGFTISGLGLLILFALSVVTYFILMSLYRIFQNLLPIGRTFPERIRKFDEREVPMLAGLYGLVPFGAVLMILDSMSHKSLSGLGAVIMVQGVALFLGGYGSQRIKS